MRAVVPITALLSLLLATSLRAADAVDYLREVKPLLAARCYACHGGLQQKGALRLDTAKSVREGGNSGPAVVPGKASDSLLIAHVTASGGKRRMPPADLGEALSEKQVALLRSWIDQGADGPADEKPEPDPKAHWAFRAPVRPAVPAFSRDPKGSAQQGRVRNPIDAFLAAEREKHGLTPQPPADRATLLRRVTLDLIGLPPTPEQLSAFLADPSPDAYEKVVDRLLASPQYGERWGRHWMDVWRYSDWWGLGAEVRNSQKHIWHWRDWIIESVNADKGYDQMVREMLAADELYPTDLDRLRATGFLARQYFLFNRNTWLEETVEHTSKAFLGLTLNCAKCHDHKFDPISQQDYYRFRAFFEPYQVRTDELPGEADADKDGIPRAFDCNLDAPTYQFVRGDERQPIKSRPLTPGVPRLLAFADLDIRPLPLPPEAYSPGLRPFVLADNLRFAEARIAAAREQLAQAKTALAAQERVGPLPPTARGPAAVVLAERVLITAEALPLELRARVLADRARAQQPPSSDFPTLAQLAALAEKRSSLAWAEEAVARAEYDLLGADAAKKPAAEARRKEAVDAVAAAKKALEAPGEAYTPLRGAIKAAENNLETEASRNKPYPTTSSGRRSALARWMTDRRHPLTARVAVNHVWARHFGKPLVGTVFDFGRKGTPPTHPELLDWLAVEFMDSGWSLKCLHRLMVTSDAYRMTSSGAGASANRSTDGENRWYWRMNPVRMEAEVIRDSLLSLAGDLDPRMGGDTVPANDETSRRRSLYFFHSHNEEQRFLAMFDEASVLECYRRAESIVPQQALAVSNSRLALGAAARINARLHERLGNVGDAEFIRAAFEMVLTTVPTPEEQKECEAALRELREALKGQPDPARRARGDLIQALLNHNDFITVR
jgi:mono/diheme cytochrome c family protein